MDGTSAIRRSTRTTAKRARKSMVKTHRLIKMRRFATGKQRFRKLWKSNTFPTEAYGVAAFGLSPFFLKPARQRCAAAVQTAHGQCVHTVIHVGHLPGADPDAAAAWLAIKWWTSQWRDSDTSMRRRLTALWHGTLARLQALRNSRGLWNAVRGPVAALIAVLWRLGFECPHPDQWSVDDQHGKQHFISDNFGSGIDLQHAVNTAVLRSVDSEISDHWSGRSDGELPDYSLVRLRHRRLLRQERRAEAGRLMSA